MNWAPLLFGICAFSLYILSSPPGVGLWDTAEFQTVAWIAGIPHPTGFPAFVIAGWLFTHLLPFGNPAWRLTMMAATASALSCALLVGSLRRFGVSPSVAAATGALFCVGDVVWIHATRAGVESLLLLFGSLATSCAIIWVCQGDRRAFILTCFFTGSALATHLVSVWFIPGLLILLLTGLRRRSIPVRTLGIAAAAMLAALSSYAYLPIRSAVIDALNLDPTTSLGLPPGQQIWNCDNPSTLAGFMHLVSGAGYNAAASLHAFYDFARYPQFFGRLKDLLTAQIGIVASLLALLGLFSLLPRHRRLFAGIAVIAFGPIPFSMEYNTADIAKYYLLTLWSCAWLCGAGAHFVSKKLPKEIACVPALVLALYAGIMFQQNGAARFAQRLDTSGQTVIADVLAHTEDNAVINGQWYAVTPVAYGRYVEGVLGMRIPLPIAEKSQLLAWSRTRPVYWIGDPDGSLQSTPGALATLVPNTWPPLYRITPAR